MIDYKSSTRMTIVDRMILCKAFFIENNKKSKNNKLEIGMLVFPFFPLWCVMVEIDIS